MSRFYSLITEVEKEFEDLNITLALTKEVVSELFAHAAWSHNHPVDSRLEHLLKIKKKLIELDLIEDED